MLNSVPHFYNTPYFSMLMFEKTLIILISLQMLSCLLKYLHAHVFLSFLLHATFYEALLYIVNTSMKVPKLWMHSLSDVKNSIYITHELL